MKAPPVEYVRSSYGHVAYQVFGEGPRDLLVRIGYLASIESYWEFPPAVAAFQRLARLGRVVVFDPPGIGASDAPPVLDDAFDERFVEASVATLAEVGSTGVVAVGHGIQGPCTWGLAAQRPDLVEQCVSVNSWPTAADDLRANTDEWVDRILWPEDTARDFLTIWAPGAVEDRAFISWFERAGRQGASPAVAERFTRWLGARAWWDELAAVRCPITVVHGSRVLGATDARCREFAERVPNAEFVVVDSADSIAFTPDFNKYVGAIEAAVTGTSAPSADRTLATVVFTDLVDSTARAAELGDERWRALLDQHDHLCASVVTRHGGEVVKSTGDGCLATFGSPSAAVDAARLLVETLADIGLPARSGVHLGEIEVRGADVGGLAVNLAARVCGAAGGGEVWVTEAVRQATLGGAHAYTPAGDHELKGVPGTWALSRLA